MLTLSQKALIAKIAATGADLGKITAISKAELDLIASRAVPTTVDQAYSKLGLVQLDRFVLARVEENEDQQPEGYPYRQIGASTWMCVRAALDLLYGTSVLISAPTMQTAVDLGQWTMRIVDRLASKSLERTIHPGGVEFLSPKATLRCEEDPLDYTDHTPDTYDLKQRLLLSGTRIYKDVEWKQRTIRLALGPEEMAQEIRLEANGRYYAYDEDGEQLMELSAQGAIDLTRAERRYGPVRCIGFLVPPKEPENLAGPANLFGPPDSPKTIVKFPNTRILDLNGGNATRGYATNFAPGYRQRTKSKANPR